MLVKLGYITLAWDPHYHLCHMPSTSDLVLPDIVDKKLGSIDVDLPLDIYDIVTLGGKDALWSTCTTYLRE